MSEATSTPRLPPLRKREHLHALLFGVRNLGVTPDIALVLIEEWADDFAKRNTDDAIKRYTEQIVKP